MSHAVGFPAGIRTHHFRECESRSQSVRLQSYNASDLYLDVLASNLCRGIYCSDRGIRCLPATVQANEGIEAASYPAWRRDRIPPP
jgi:hypothetical protein